MQWICGKQNVSALLMFFSYPIHAVGTDRIR